jgi:hypothetical protein
MVPCPRGPSSLPENARRLGERSVPNSAVGQDGHTASRSVFGHHHEAICRPALVLPLLEARVVLVTVRPNDLQVRPGWACHFGALRCRHAIFKRLVVKGMVGRNATTRKPFSLASQKAASTTGYRTAGHSLPASGVPPLVLRGRPPGGWDQGLGSSSALCLPGGAGVDLCL